MARTLLWWSAVLLVTLAGACGDDDGPTRDDAGTSLDGGGGTGEDGGPGMDGGPPDAGDVEDAGPADSGTGGDDDAGPEVDAGTDAGPVSMPCTASGECDPFDATACPDGQSCRPGGSSGTACQDVVDAPAAEDDPCSASNECGPGLLCLDFGDGFTCQRMCPEGSIGFCGDGKRCVGSIGDACIHICRPIPEECNIYDQDCVDPDDTCTFARDPETNAPYTGCRPAGTQGHGEDCSGGAGSCGHSLVCIRSTTGTTCHYVCRTEGRDPACTVSGETCSGEARTWGVTYCRAP